MKVLLVDDEEEMVATLAERLFLRGIAADWVLCGNDAVGRIREERYDVVVLDVKMPGMSGIETMAEIRRIQPSTKIIFLTGHGSTADCEAGISAGASFYLIKPIDIKVLIDSMNEAVRGQGGRI